jgi:DNA-binding IclR family transcriptional regulator
MSGVMPAGPRAAAIRRSIRPVAWCALECLLERSDDGRTSTASVRSIAADLGVAKNTAQRAVASLVRAGVAEAVQERDARGRFRPGRYRLNLTDLVAAPTPTHPPRRRRPRAARRAAPTQLSLLPPS